MRLERTVQKKGACGNVHAMFSEKKAYRRMYTRFGRCEYENMNCLKVHRNQKKLAVGSSQKEKEREEVMV